MLYWCTVRKSSRNGQKIKEGFPGDSTKPSLGRSIIINYYWPAIEKTWMTYGMQEVACTCKSNVQKCRCASETNGSRLCRFNMKVSAMTSRYSCLIVISSIRPVRGLHFFQDCWTKACKSSSTYTSFCEIFSGHFQNPRLYLRVCFLHFLQQVGQQHRIVCLP